MKDWHLLPDNLRIYFEQTPDILQGKLCIRGTRISVEQVLELLGAGVSPAEIVSSFPSLTLQDVLAVEQLAVHSHLQQSGLTM